MRAFLVLLSVLFCVALATAKYAEDPAFRQFQEFQQKYGKSYSNIHEFQQRFSIFKSNLAAAKVLQANEKGSAVYGVTKFFDLTSTEFRQKYLLPKFTAADWPKASVFPPAPNTTRPDYYGFDWNSKGVITPVYNQGQCGSCWAFSATETIESYWAIAGNTLTELSMQQIVDCDTTDSGCGGGWPYNAYNYVISAGGLESLSEYPYTAENGYCEFNAGYVVASINNWAYVTQSEDETAMYNWVNSNGPMSVCVDASSWQYYQGGVVSSCTTNLDHCVQLTGYTNGMQGYNAWDIRNSWGSDWGENGYIYLEMGQNTCGVAEVVTAVSA